MTGAVMAIKNKYGTHFIDDRLGVFTSNQQQITHLFSNKQTRPKIKQTRPLRSVINICQKKLCLDILDYFFFAPQLFPFSLFFLWFFFCFLSVCLSSSQENV